MRVANHKLEAYFAERKPIENYNGTIVAKHERSRYEVWHWNTMIACVGDDGALWFRTDFISQTTAKLLGRFMRSQDRKSVLQVIGTAVFLGNIDAKRQRQLLAQLW